MWTTTVGCNHIASHSQWELSLWVKQRDPLLQSPSEQCHLRWKGSTWDFPELSDIAQDANCQPISQTTNIHNCHQQESNYRCQVYDSLQKVEFRVLEAFMSQGVSVDAYVVVCTHKMLTGKKTSHYHLLNSCRVSPPPKNFCAERLQSIISSIL